MKCRKCRETDYEFDGECLECGDHLGTALERAELERDELREAIRRHMRKTMQAGRALTADLELWAINDVQKEAE